MGKHHDWSEIERDCKENGLTYAKAAKKYGVSLSSLKKAASRQKWGLESRVRDRSSQIEAQILKLEKELEEETEPEPVEENGTEEPTAELEVTCETEPVPFTADNVLPAMSRAERFQKLIDDMTDRVEDAICVVDVHNPGAIKLLTAALKDLRDLKHMNRTALDIEEQKARIEKLRSEVRTYEDTGEHGVIMLPEVEKVSPPE